jgi:hypothetical protein
MVAGSARGARQTRDPASPRVMIVAFVLSPNPDPAAMPTATAMTFFTAPASSTRRRRRSLKAGSSRWRTGVHLLRPADVDAGED